VILRGGREGPNYDAAGVASALELLRQASLPERVMIDLSHDNSRKDPERQPQVAADVAAQLADGSPAIVGAMLESFLVGGRQKLADGQPLTYGQSITDGCLSWDATVAVLESLAGGVRARRRTTDR
jgi:3-deoxy-7-phosphoheptulonate synthase